MKKWILAKNVILILWGEIGKILWSRKWQLALVFLPGKFHGQRSLVGYSAWSHKESDTTEQHHHQCELTSLYFHSEMKCRAPCPSIPHPLLIVQTLHLLNLHSIKHSSSPGLHAHNSWSLRAKFKYWWWWFSHSVIPDSFVTPCTVAGQAPLSMAFSRQEYWSGLPFPFSEDLLDQGIEPKSSALQADSLLLSHQGSPYLSIIHP